jgi:hypothetical protein
MSSAPADFLQWAAACMFAAAVIHTFSTKFLEHLARTHPRHAGLFHLMGEVEVVFGLWAMALVLLMLVVVGNGETISYLESRNFTEPMFVFAIMVVAGTRPVLDLCSIIVRILARAVPARPAIGLYFMLLAVVPLFGSFITEPAAMTLAALMLRDTALARPTSTQFRYATIGVLFVNISVGGTLTPFAAPPVLMVASAWGWDLAFMMTNFGWKAAIIVLLNASVITFMFRSELLRSPSPDARSEPRVPATVMAVHVFFLAVVVFFSHHTVMFMGALLFFIGYTTAYNKYQTPLILREALLVAFFLGGLVVLGGQQEWWLQPLLLSMDASTVFYGAAALTAITDNAALTYLGSLVEGLSDEFKLALVSGAVAGGGLTVIANAPNPAGVAILREKFSDEAIHPLGLLIGALAPTIVALLVFRLL